MVRRGHVPGSCSTDGSRMEGSRCHAVNCALLAVSIPGYVHRVNEGLLAATFKPCDERGNDLEGCMGDGDCRESVPTLRCGPSLRCICAMTYLERLYRASKHARTDTNIKLLSRSLLLTTVCALGKDMSRIKETSAQPQVCIRRVQPPEVACSIEETPLLDRRRPLASAVPLGCGNPLPSRY